MRHHQSQFHSLWFNFLVLGVVILPPQESAVRRQEGNAHSEPLLERVPTNAKKVFSYLT